MKLSFACVKLQSNENNLETLDFDSFDALQFLVALNEKTGIDIPEHDCGKTSTLKGLLAYFTSKKTLSFICFKKSVVIFVQFHLKLITMCHDFYHATQVQSRNNFITLMCECLKSFKEMKKNHLHLQNPV